MWLRHLLLFGLVFAFAVSCAGSPDRNDNTNNNTNKTGTNWWDVNNDNKTNNTNKNTNTSNVKQDCYDGCIKKGQPKEVCTKACSGSTGAGNKCYDDCINLPKKPGHDACTKYCANRSGGTSCKTDQDCAKSTKTPKCDRKSGKCIAEGGKTDEKCGYGGQCPCYEACLKAGGSPGSCENKCFPGGVGIKDKEAEACYNKCIKEDKEKHEVCYPKCYPLQACLATCAKGGEKPEVCTPKCEKECKDKCLKSGATNCDTQCTNKSSGKDPGKGSGDTCYETCTKAGGKPDACKTGCTCYSTCRKSGGDDKSCKGKCFK